jgi:predicted transcriptional regulator
MDVAPPTRSSAATINSFGDAYKSMTAAYFASLLEQTRARATQLPVVEMSSMDATERGWRDENRELIEAIYGKTDVLISETERQFIDRVARELKDGIGRKEGWECVVSKFKTQLE